MRFLRQITIATICLTTLGTIGCASPTVDITKTAKGFYEATDPNNVDILQTLPTRKSVELGTISTNRWDPGDTAKMHNALREKAAGLGANAVVIQNSGINQISTYTSYLWATGVALRYVD